MQINGNELGQYLKKDLSPVYIISSNELFWQQFYTKQILNTAFSKGYPQDSVIRFTGDMFKSKDDLSKLAEACTSIGLFADKVIVTIDLEKGNNSTFKAIHQEVLSVIDECLNDSLLVVITLPRLSKNEISSCKPLSTLVNKGLFAIFYELNESQLTKHVKTMASSYGIILDDLEASFLVSSYEGNLTSLDQILKKLQLCGISGKINLDELKQHVSPSNHYSIFDINEAFINTAITPNKRLVMLEALMGDGFSLNEIIRQIGTAFTSLYEMRNLIEQGLPLNQYFESHKLLKYVKFKQDMYAKAASKIKLEQLRELISLLSKADLLCRNFDEKQAYIILRELAVRISNPNKKFIDE